MVQEKGSKAKTHFYISLIKSALRIVGCYFLFKNELGTAAFMLALAEVLGIAEEIF